MTEKKLIETTKAPEFSPAARKIIETALYARLRFQVSQKDFSGAVVDHVFHSNIGNIVSSEFHLDENSNWQCLNPETTWLTVTNPGLQQINEVSHQRGNQSLVDTVDICQKVTGNSGSIYRLGAANFTIALKTPPNDNQIESIAQFRPPSFKNSNNPDIPTPQLCTSQTSASEIVNILNTTKITADEASARNLTDVVLQLIEVKREYSVLQQLITMTRQAPPDAGKLFFQSFVAKNFGGIELSQINNNVCLQQALDKVFSRKLPQDKTSFDIHAQNAITSHCYTSILNDPTHPTYHEPANQPLDRRLPELVNTPAEPISLDELRQKYHPRSSEYYANLNRIHQVLTQDITPNERVLSKIEEEINNLHLNFWQPDQSPLNLYQQLPPAEKEEYAGYVLQTYRDLVSTDLLSRDPMTGFLRLDEFNRRSKKLIETAIKEKKPCSIISVDLNLLNLISNTAGRKFGDGAIFVTAKSLEEGASTAITLDNNAQILISRTGGDEFTILIFGSPETAKAFIQEFQKEHRQHQIPGPNDPNNLYQPDHIHCNLGVCNINEAREVLSQQCLDNLLDPAIINLVDRIENQGETNEIDNLAYSSLVQEIMVDYSEQKVTYDKPLQRFIYLYHMYETISQANIPPNPNSYEWAAFTHYLNASRKALHLENTPEDEMLDKFRQYQRELTPSTNRLQLLLKIIGH